MTPDPIKAAVEQLATLLGDPEEAHITRDFIWETALRLIAECHHLDEAKAVAQEALQTNNLDIDLWYA